MAKVTKDIATWILITELSNDADGKEDALVTDDIINEIQGTLKCDEATAEQAYVDTRAKARDMLHEYTRQFDDK